MRGETPPFENCAQSMPKEMVRAATAISMALRLRSRLTAQAGGGIGNRAATCRTSILTPESHPSSAPSGGTFSLKGRRTLGRARPPFRADPGDARASAFRRGAIERSRPKAVVRRVCLWLLTSPQTIRTRLERLIEAASPNGQ